jgi:hypothetical protein
MTFVARAKDVFKKDSEFQLLLYLCHQPAEMNTCSSQIQQQTTFILSLECQL